MSDYVKTPKRQSGDKWVSGPAGIFEYQDAGGRPVLRVTREYLMRGGDPVMDPEKGKQRKRCLQYYIGYREKPAHWRPVPYRLPELRKAVTAGRTVLIVEGEQKVDRLRALGFDATCNAGGARKWSVYEAEELRGAADVVILPDNDSHGRDHADIVARSLVQFELEPRLLELPNLAEHEDVLDWLGNGGSKEQLEALLADAGPYVPYGDGAVTAPGVLVSDTDHMDRARMMREALRPNLWHYRDDWWDWQRGAYKTIAESAIRARSWAWLSEVMTKRKGAVVPFEPNRTRVEETLAALEAVAHLDPELAMPCWLDGREGPPPGELVAFPNGLLDLRSGALLEPDPALFTQAALGFDYQRGSPEPEAWLKFLGEIFEDDAEQIGTLQEIFGYLITGDVSLEKAFLLLGPARSGKGTILRMIRSLLATPVVIGPSLMSLGTNFGLAALVGRQLAIIDDLRVGSRKEQEVLAENLLKITGRGWFTIDRKYKDHWSGVLPVKLMLVSNVMPQLGDESGALASRFIVLETQRSFYGKEDPRLFEDRLEPERMGALHWSLDGLKRVRERGYIAEPDKCKSLQHKLSNLGSNAKAFVYDCCVLDQEESEPKDVLYGAYKSWCQEQGLRAESSHQFFRDLYAATGQKVKPARHRGADGQTPYCAGIRLRLSQEAESLARAGH